LQEGHHGNSEKSTSKGKGEKGKVDVNPAIIFACITRKKRTPSVKRKEEKKGAHRKEP